MAAGTIIIGSDNSSNVKYMYCQGMLEDKTERIK